MAPTLGRILTCSSCINHNTPQRMQNYLHMPEFAPVTSHLHCIHLESLQMGILSTLLQFAAVFHIDCRNEHLKMRSSISKAIA